MPPLEQIQPLTRYAVENTSNGVIFAVTAIPTLGIDRQQGIGGIGETWFADTLGLRLGKEVLGFGKAFRTMAIAEAGRELTETEFEAWRTKLAVTHSVEQEYKVDGMLWNLAQEEANSTETPISVIAGKAVSYLMAQYLKDENKPTVVAIGVFIDDQEATRRAWKRQHKELNREPNKTELENTANSRYARRLTERSNYIHAYPTLIPDYSQETILPSLNYAFDNTPERTQAEMMQIINSFLHQFAIDHPSLSNSIIEAIAK